MGIKGKMARLKVKQRRRRNEKLDREAQKLALQRNKALKDAEVATRKANLLEEKRKAELKKMDAEARVKALKSKSRQQRNARAIKSGRKTASALGKMARGAHKWLSSRAG